MKKKLSILLLAIFLLPLFALFGCNETTSYTFSVTKNTTHGMITFPTSGKVTHAEGETVTLKAYATGEDLSGEKNHFVCWLFQKNQEIVDNEVYNLENKTDEKTQKITESTLTFKASQATQGSYIAIFNDASMMYAKLESFSLTGVTASSINFSIWHNNSSKTAYTTSYEFTQTTGAAFDDVTSILAFSNSTASSFKVNASVMIEGQEKTFSNLKTDISHQNPFDVEYDSKNNIGRSVLYADGTYTISFALYYTESDYAVLTFVYKELDKFSTTTPAPTPQPTPPAEEPAVPTE